jgi:hypothetical protein
MIETRGMRIMLLVNAGIAFAGLLLLALEASGLDLTRLDDATPATASGVKLLLWSLTLAFVVFNGVYILERFVVKRATHLKAKGEQSEFLVAISAVEDSLSRIARCVPEVHDARVSVYKEKREGKPVYIEVSYMAYEDMAIPQVTERLQQVVAHRFEQIAGPEIKPQFSIILSRIVEREANAGRPDRRRSDGGVVDLSRGPVYPVSEE